MNNKMTVMAGVIDPDYTGEIKVILYNYGTKPYAVHPRAKIAQLILEKFESIPTEIVPDLRKQKEEKSALAAQIMELKRCRALLNSIQVTHNLVQQKHNHLRSAQQVLYST